MVAAFSVKPSLRVRDADYTLAGTSSPSGFPWFTTVLFILIAGLFITELQVAPPIPGQLPAPTRETIVAMGGLSRSLALPQEGYRMLSAPFLHGSVAHLLVDLLLIGLAGAMLEMLVGQAWLFFIFAFGALAGSAMSVVLLPAQMLMIGTSGAVVAMLSAVALISLRQPLAGQRARLQILILLCTAIALFPIDHGAGAGGWIYAPHLGGLLAGMVIGVLLLLTWPRDAALPDFRVTATILSSLAALSIACTALAVAANYPQYAAGSDLIPPATYPQDVNEQRLRVNELLSQYPRDPRAHVIAANVDLSHGDRVGAEYELRVALTFTNDHTEALFPSLNNTVYGALSVIMLDQGHRNEALALAKAPCQAAGDLAPPADVIAKLLKANLCSGVRR